MNINRETKITRQAISFLDGENGWFQQNYELSVNGEKLGITMVVSGNLGKENTKKEFHTKNDSFDDFKDALKNAGHDYN